MPSGRPLATYNALSHATVAGHSSSIAVTDFVTATVSITATGGYHIKLKGATLPPWYIDNANTFGLGAGAKIDRQRFAQNHNFAAADSITNPWSYIMSIDLADGSELIGELGFTGGAGTVQVEVNVNYLDLLCAELVSISAGEVNITINCT